MPTVLAHAVFGAALYVPFRHRLPPRAALAGAFAAVVPDFDVAGFRFGIEYADLLGHRGLTHSLAFAAALGALAAVIFSRTIPERSRLHAWLYLALATASHGLFDALTDGGLGVALLAPFTNGRFFFSVAAHRGITTWTFPDLLGTRPRGVRKRAHLGRTPCVGGRARWRARHAARVWAALGCIPNESPRVLRARVLRGATTALQVRGGPDSPPDDCSLFREPFGRRLL